MLELVDLKIAKKLKELCYSIPCEYYWQEIDLPYSSSGLKKLKNNKKLNHNKYDHFVYSAPTISDALKWILNDK